MNLFLLLLISYLIGSIMFAEIIAKIFKLGNLREKGSKNVGASNVLRVGGKYGKILSFITFLLDASKGAVAVWICKNYYNTDLVMQMYCGYTAVIGHIFPIWSKFRGGKGIATFLGVIFAVNVQLGLILMIVWLLFFAITRTPFISSIIIVLINFIIFSVINEGAAKITLLISLFIIAKHKSNIVRLINKEEKKMNL